MSKFLIGKNNLIFWNQSGLKPGNSCINHLFLIYHKIYKSFDDRFEVKDVFLHILKVFDKVWHKVIIFKLKQNGIFCELLSILSDFLKDRKYRTILN